MIAIRRESVLIVVALAALHGMSCYDTNTQRCADGLRCAVGYECIPLATDSTVWQCVAGGCGDGLLEQEEECDDGNVEDGDGCSADCRFEGCGNGVIEGNEQCDDGNNRGGDGCSADCLSGESCGNGLLDLAGNEQCDDGNIEPGDGCSAVCKFEECGNGFVDADELCDDDNNVSGDGCSADCLSLEVCGNGRIDVAAGEICDDGNVSDGDGCAADCQALRNIARGQCYLVSDGTDELLIIDRTNPDPSGNTVAIGPLGPFFDVEAIALETATGILFGADGVEGGGAGRLGIIDTDTGAFIPLPEDMGIGVGVAGTISFEDVDGLAFDPTTGVLYGSVRQRAGPDLLIKLDPLTGSHIADGFGEGIDYVVIPSTGAAEDIDDIAIDLDGTLYGIANETGVSDRLVVIDKNTGATTDVGPTVIDDIESLDFDIAGSLWGSSGSNNELFSIDKTIGVAFIAAPIALGGDHEALDCL